MKKFQSSIICLSFVFFFFSCEPENLSQHSNPTIGEPVMTSAPVEALVLPQNADFNCTEISFMDYGRGILEIDLDGVTLSPSSSEGFSELAVFKYSDVPCNVNLDQGIRTANASALMLDFDETIISFNATVFGENPHVDQVKIQGYSGPDGTGDLLYESIYTPSNIRGIFCTEMSIEGVGIKSVVFSSTNELRPNGALIASFEFCSTSDSDGDGINDNADNCPQTANAGQEDYDEDSAGDVCDPDDDNDGTLDVEDSIPFSNKEATVMIAACDSRVVNQHLSDGVFMSDLVDELESGEYKNLGQTVRSFNDLMNNWVNSGVITGEQKTLILNCAISENQ